MIDAYETAEMSIPPRASLKGRIRKILDALAERHGYKIVPSSVLYDWQIGRQSGGYERTTTDGDPENYLNMNNSRLKEAHRQLRRDGSRCHHALDLDRT